MSGELQCYFSIRLQRSCGILRVTVIKVETAGHRSRSKQDLPGHCCGVISPRCSKKPLGSGEELLLVSFLTFLFLDVSEDVTHSDEPSRTRPLSSNSEAIRLREYRRKLKEQMKRISYIGTQIFRCIYRRALIVIKEDAQRQQGCCPSAKASPVSKRVASIWKWFFGISIVFSPGPSVRSLSTSASAVRLRDYRERKAGKVCTFFLYFSWICLSTGS